MSDKKQVRPWDLFNKNMERALPIIQEKRLEICKECPRFVRLTSQCKECGCIMPAKVKLSDATCPLSKWNKLSKVVPMHREISEEDLNKIKEIK